MNLNRYKKILTESETVKIFFRLNIWCRDVR